MDGKFLGINSGSFVHVFMKSEKDVTIIDPTKMKDLKSVTKRDEKERGKPLFSDAKRDGVVKKIFSAIESMPEAGKLRDMLRTDLANNMAQAYKHHYGKNNGIVVVGTGLDLARKGTRVQEWMWERGLNIGQPRKFSFAGNNDKLNGCKK